MSVSWIAAGYKFVSAVVTCAVDHVAEITTTAVDFGKCVIGKFFQA